MDFALSGSSTSKIALLVDCEKTVPAGGGDLSCLLDQAAESGWGVIRRAYAQGARFPAHNPAMRLARFEMIDVASVNGKNLVDIKLVVDAMEIAFAKPFVGAFILVSGDSDFIPLVVKLNELNRRAWLCLGQRKPSPALAKLCVRLSDELAPQPAVAGDQQSTSAPHIGPTTPKQQTVPGLAGPNRINLSAGDREKFKLAVQLCTCVVVPPLGLNRLFTSLRILQYFFRRLRPATPLVRARRSRQLELWLAYNKKFSATHGVLSDWRLRLRNQSLRRMHQEMKSLRCPWPLLQPYSRPRRGFSADCLLTANDADQAEIATPVW